MFLNFGEKFRQDFRKFFLYFRKRIFAKMRKWFLRKCENENFLFNPNESYFVQDITYEDGRIAFFGSNPEKECGIKINNVAESDNGQWK